MRKTPNKPEWAERLIRLAYDQPELLKHAGFKDILKKLFKTYKKDHPNSEKPPKSLVDKAKEMDGKGEDKKTESKSEREAREYGGEAWARRTFDADPKMPDDLKEVGKQDFKKLYEKVLNQIHRAERQDNWTKNERRGQHGRGFKIYNDPKQWEEAKERSKKNLESKKELLKPLQAEIKRRGLPERVDFNPFQPIKGEDPKKPLTEFERRDKLREMNNEYDKAWGDSKKASKGSAMTRNQLIKLAYDRPDLRSKILPILKEAGEFTEQEWKTHKEKFPGAEAKDHKITKGDGGKGNGESKAKADPKALHDILGGKWYDSEDAEKDFQKIKDTVEDLQKDIKGGDFVDTFDILRKDIGEDRWDENRDKLIPLIKEIAGNPPPQKVSEQGVGAAKALRVPKDDKGDLALKGKKALDLIERSDLTNSLVNFNPDALSGQIYNGMSVGEALRHQLGTAMDHVLAEKDDKKRSDAMERVVNEFGEAADELGMKWSGSVGTAIDSWVNDNLKNKDKDMKKKAFLRSQLIRLAHNKPELRSKILPLIKQADEGEEEAKAGPSKRPGGKFIQFMKEMGDEKVRNPDTGNDVKLKSLKGDRGKKLQHEKFEKWLASQEKSKGKSDEKGGKPPAKSEGTKDKGPDNKPSGGSAAIQKVLKGDKKASLRSSLIRLAHEKPELRDHLLPILKEARGKPWESALEWLGGQRRLKAMIGAKDFAYSGSNEIRFRFPKAMFCTIKVSSGRSHDEYNYEMKIESIREGKKKYITVSEEDAIKHNVAPGKHWLGDRHPVSRKTLYHQKNLIGEELSYEFQKATGLRLSL